jgi:hypothetical protein
MIKSAYTTLVKASKEWFYGANIIFSNHCTIMANNSLLVGQPIAAQS